MHAVEVTSAARAWRLGHRPGLDGLRGLAILLVLTNHVVKNAGVDNQMGGAGVTLFFTLSGFLITSLLVEEYDANGRISLWRFYERRARRLLPALIVMLAVVSAYVSVAGFSSPAWALVPLFYVSNWFSLAGHPPPFFPHTWSLSVEEQFYLVWPLLVIAARRRAGILALLCVVGIGWANVMRVAFWHGGLDTERVYLGTDGHADALLLGCLLALAAHRFGLPRLPRAVTITAVVLIIVFGAMSPGVPFLIVLAVVPWLSAVAIVGCCTLGADRVLGWFGRRSYAIYLWHVPLIIIALHFRSGVGPALIGAGVSLGVAELSWQMVERRWLRPRGAHGGEPYSRAPALAGGHIRGVE